MIRRETVVVTHLCTGYTGKGGTKVVASDITAALRSGELTCLLGANGAGKSTLLRTLSAFQPALSGEIRIGGRSLGAYAPRELSTLIGVVLTEKTDLHNMRVEELVGMGRSPYTGFWGGLGAADRRIVNEAIGLVRIEGLRGRMVHTLSDGERQKVMIAKVLAQQTPVIFLDEPTAFLDFPSKVEIMLLLRRLARDMEKTVFLSTHDLELALQIADRLWLMEPGGGVRTGTPEDLALDGSLSRFFSGEGIRFDVGSGLFRIDCSGTRTVRLEGAGIRCAMAAKALARIGLRAAESSKTGWWIEAGGPEAAEFVCHAPDGTVQACPTVEALLEALTAAGDGTADGPKYPNDDRMLSPAFPPEAGVILPENSGWNVYK